MEEIYNKNFWFYIQKEKLIQILNRKGGAYVLANDAIEAQNYFLEESKKLSDKKIHNYLGTTNAKDTMGNNISKGKLNIINIRMIFMFIFHHKNNYNITDVDDLFSALKTDNNINIKLSFDIFFKNLKLVLGENNPLKKYSYDFDYKKGRFYYYNDENHSDNYENLVSPILPKHKEVIVNTQKVSIYNTSSKNLKRGIDRPLEFPEKNYYGRENEKNKLKNFIGKKAGGLQLIYGLGGIGKTHLVSQVKKDLKIQNEIYIDCPLNSNYGLHNIINLLGINLDINQKPTILIEFICQAIREMGRLIIIDNFQNIKDLHTRNILKKWSLFEQVKIIIISRNFPDELNYNSNIKENAINIGFLPYKDYEKYISDISTKYIDNEDVKKIFKKTNGYPYITLLILDGIDYQYSLDTLLEDLINFDEDLNSISIDKNINRLLNHIFENGDKDEIALLTEMSAFQEPVEISLVSKLNSFSVKDLKNISFKRSFINIENSKYKMPDIIKEFAYANLKNKDATHLLIGNAFLNNFEENEDFNGDIIRAILYHFSSCKNNIHLQDFRIRFKEKFKETKTKSFLDNTLKTNTDFNIKTYLLLTKANPENPKYISQLSTLYRNDKKFEKGFALVNNSLLKDEFKNDVYLQLERIKYFIEFKKEERAIADLSNIVNSYKENTHSRIELGKLYVKSKRYLEAEKLFIEAKVIDKENVHSRTELGKLYVKSKRYLEAEKLFIEAKVIDKKHLHSRTELGKLYVKLKRYQEAEKLFIDANLIDKKHLHSRTELGKLYVKLKRYQEAEKLFIDVNLIDKKHLHSRTELGKLYIKLERYQEAEKLLIEVNAIDKENVHSRNELGNLYIKLKKHYDAEKQFIEVVKIDCKNTFSTNGLARLYFNQNKTRKSIDILKKVKSHSKNKDNYFIIRSLLYAYLKIKDQYKYEKLLEYIQNSKNEKLKSQLGKFKNFNAQNKTLINAYQIGIIENINGSLFIKGIRYKQNWNRITHTKNLEHNSKVYYATYNMRNHQIIIDYVEPYFEI